MVSLIERGFFIKVGGHTLYNKELHFSQYNIDSFDIISFDIFDTLLYRLCHKPEDVFKSLGDELTNLPYSSLMFKSLRVRAEARARDKAKKNGKFEISFDDIYDEMSFLKDSRGVAMQQEIACEKNVLMLNTHVYDFLKCCHANGKKIILVSDMYYSKSQIVHFLVHVGIDMDNIDDVFVSSEYDSTKYNGNLYGIVINTLGNNKILHIGDNYQSDVVSAKKYGLETIHYNPIIEENFSIYQMESQFTQYSVDEIRSLRKLMNTTNVFTSELEQGAYAIGSQIIGPVYALFMEWVAELAIKNGIQKIVPLMREGELYSRLLRTLNEKRGLSIEIEPIYISRKSSYLAQFEIVTQQELLELMQRNRVQLKTVFDLLLIEIEQTEYAEYAFQTMDQLKKIQFDNSTVYDSIYHWLSSSEKLEWINKHAKKQRQYLTQYIQQITEGNDFLTVDLGFNGTMQKIISDLVLDNQQSYHALVVAGDKVKDKILGGYQIFAWLGYAQENEHAIKTIIRSPEIIEATTNISIGSTKKYEFDKENNHIVPILENSIFPKEHIYFQEICWQGITDFQSEWLKVCDHAILSNLYLKHEGFRAIFLRLIEYPTQQEAKLLGALIQHEYCNFTHEMSIVNDTNITLLNSIGIEEFLNKTSKTFFPYEVYWPQGVIENIYPNYFLRKYIEQNLKTELDKDIYKLLVELTVVRDTRVLIYGAGELGNQIFNMAKLLNVNIASFIDRNYMQMPDGFHGLPVISLDEVKGDVTHIIIGSLSFKAEILNTIRAHFINRHNPQLLTID